MPWSRCQPHGFILSWRNIPVNRVGRFYSMFVWIGAAWVHFCVNLWLCYVFRGESVGGCAPPNLRQRVFDSLDSPHAAAGLGWCKYTSLQKAPVPQSAHPHLQSPGTRKDLTGSNLWPVRSCCIEMIPTRSIVQTRAAPKRRRVGLRARSGEEAGTADRSPGTRKDPPGSNLWPGGSCCIEMLSVHSIVQTRAAPKRRGVGLQRAERSACRLSLLSP